MGNFIKLALVVFVIQLAFIITGIAEFPGTSLYHFLLNPTDWAGTDFLALVSGGFLTAATVMLIVGGTAITRSDLFIFAAMAGVFLSLGQPLAELFSIISTQVNWQLAAIIVSPIILIYVLTVIEWWRRG